MFMYHVLTNIIPQQHILDEELMFLELARQSF
jgi:hypothetical protein